ncbi:cytochrome ubiquinol oxidase subunit I [Catellatospora coxensis]|uniref:Cytochrome ubiquinol oxidase subunit I n=1 Tax=Catellatospora coxensis TaxID=310354 RepID=A0A8J3KRC8_9ACTN|nr:cytochrome ubiquinol oxidase subunit I [Catellatospora coxensis]GIG04828.1 cytochrome ubiquinol oxidase subunit I [Catellatospora coxensis]
MSNVDLARIQFAMTSIYHFIFVPITIGLGFLTAILQTVWHRTGRDEYLRATKFFGVLLVINVAVGVVTGLVQEFQFGMDWSAYSRMVGDVFGAPLAMEGLAAFFLESTFLGLWIFGWGKLSPRIHLAAIWLVALGAAGSAAFIMAANSWMQHPVGYEINPTTGRPQLNDIWAVMTNPVFLWGYAHVLLAATATGCALMLAVSAWHLRRKSHPEVFAPTAKLSLIILAPTMIFAMFVGSELGVVEAKYQPMKIAAAEAQWETCQPCSFSIIQIGGGKQDQTPTKIIEVPHVLSLLATNHWNGQVVGLNEINAQYQQQYGPGDYVPNVFIQYWAMRVMAYTAVVTFLLSLWGLWVMRRKHLETARRFLAFAAWAAVLPVLMNTAGWLLTENGRQPWIVQGLMLTQNGVSPSISATTVAISLTVFFLLYNALTVVWLVLMLRYARKAPPPTVPADDVPAPEPTFSR